ncbi:MAG: type II toxin-antitoxin system VapB family antitoxin [Caulobacteraceae bacterium]
MSDAPIQIRKPEVIRDIRELAEATGQAFTDVVGDAVRHELERRRAEREQTKAERRAKSDAIRARARALPRIRPPLTDADLYDDDGFPK